MEFYNHNDILNLMLFHFPKNKYASHEKDATFRLNDEKDPTFRLNDEKKNQLNNKKIKSDMNDIYFAKLQKPPTKINDFHFAKNNLHH